MKRRDFVSALGVGAVGAAITGCAPKTQECVNTGSNSQQQIRWKMVTSWPKNFPGLGTAPERFADFVKKMSNGRLEIKVYGANELVPAMGVFDAVSGGTAEVGHSGAYYWKGKAVAAQFFTSVPFGLTAQEMNGWLLHGGGLALWEELYARYDLVPIPGGNTGVQMAGWFNKEINSLADLQGVKMRIPGLGGEVFKAASGTAVTIPGGEIFTSLQTGVIDAAEWVGPFNDLVIGFHQVAKYYYYPGWHETGPTLECIVNKEAFDSLPPDLQAIVEIAASATNDQMLAEFMARNAFALTEIEQMEDVKILPFPDDVMTALEQASDEIIAEISARDEKFKTIYQSFLGYMNTVSKWTEISEFAMLANRYKKD